MNPERILVVNAGSSSLKLRVLDPADAVVASADLAPPRGPEDGPAVADAALDAFQVQCGRQRVAALADQ